MLVVALLDAALAVWFFQTIWPGVDLWLKDNQHLSGWMQFLGAVIALIAAYHLGTRQAAAARALAREQQVVAALNTFDTIRVMLEHAHFVLKAYKQDWENFSHPPYLDDHGEWVRIRDGIAAIDAFKSNAPELLGMLLQVPRALDAAIDARDSLMDVYIGRNAGAILPKPPLKPLLDTMFNKVEQAKGMLAITLEANHKAAAEVHKKLSR